MEQICSTKLLDQTAPYPSHYFRTGTKCPGFKSQQNWSGFYGFNKIGPVVAKMVFLFFGLLVGFASFKNWY
jgi:hypothetical protein